MPGAALPHQQQQALAGSSLELKSLPAPIPEPRSPGLEREPNAVNAQLHQFVIHRQSASAAPIVVRQFGVPRMAANAVQALHVRGRSASEEIAVPVVVAGESYAQAARKPNPSLHRTRNSGSGSGRGKRHHGCCGPVNLALAVNVAISPQVQCTQKESELCLMKMNHLFQL